MEKINVAELLRNCPSGMKLDCTMYNNLYFNQICDEDGCLYPIGCYTIADGIRTSINFTEFGGFNTHINSKCVIFPKGKTTWEGFVPPCEFKDGDIITCTNSVCTFTSIFKEKRTIASIFTRYCTLRLDKNELNVGISSSDFRKPRLATKKEKQKLFDAIKENGYRWNAEIKTLEKLPKFKVGDRIRHKITNKDDVYEISKVYDDSYGFVGFTWKLYMKYQDEYELVPNKFDITALIPFESRVLMRSSNAREWTGTIFSHYSNNKFYGCGMCCDQCIPYEGNEHLLGKIDDCDEFYRTWEKTGD